MDKSIVIEPVKNAIIVEPTRNSVSASLIKVESILAFISPVQVVAERKEVG